MNVGGFIDRGENKGFSVESAQGGDSDQTEHANRHTDRQDWGLLSDPSVIINLFGKSLIPNQGDDRERTQIHEQINAKIIEQTFHRPRRTLGMRQLERGIRLDTL